MNYSEVKNETLLKEWEKICNFGKNCSNKMLGMVSRTQADIQKEASKRNLILPKI